jgi:hypothetical protein
VAPGDVPTPERWLVDGFNVLHVALGGRAREPWWGSEAREAVTARAAALGDASRVVVVFDGPRPTPGPAEHAGRVAVVFAPSADAWLLREVRRAADPSRLAVVTADRRLADRARHHGARVVAPGAFLAACAAPEARAGRADAGPETGRL